MPKKHITQFSVPTVEIPPNDLCLVSGDAASGDLAVISDQHGNSVGGFVERVDARTHLAWVHIDRSTYRGATSA